MTFQKFARDYPVQFFAALDSLDAHRLAELADRGDSAEIGRIVHHAIDAAKHETEQAMVNQEPLRWPMFGEDEQMPAMLRKQAD